MRTLTLALLLTACRTDETKTGETGQISQDTAAPTTDADHDGHDAVADGGDDCDDTDGAVHPGATEVPYNGVDDDCDPATPDDDLDGDSYAQADDCDDTDDQVHPDAVEVCNGADDDCDGVIDDNTGDTWFLDADGDGFGDPDAASVSCEGPDRYVDNDQDCDDTSAAVWPGADEVCDELDNDCDGDVDEDVTSIWYVDADGDGHGDPDSTTQACSLPTGYAEVGDDCDDGDPSRSPDADELCDGVDNDCDGDVDEGDAVDAPTWYSDGDGDGYGDPTRTTTACEAPSGAVANDQDCDDADATLNPDTVWYADRDGDGYGDADTAATGCTAPTSLYVADDTDCDDLSAGVNPGASETCDEVDDDCDGDVDEGVTSTFYTDADGDGYGDASATIQACAEASGVVADDTDCDDTNADTWPGADELCDGEDNDCDGSADDGTLGADATCAAESCAEILADQPSASSDSYYLDPTGSGSASLYECDMSTDGGGWTLAVDWDRENDGDTMADFESLMTTDFNNMSEWTSGSSYIQWSDYDSTADVMAYSVDVDVPNGGETLFDVYFYGYSYEDSAIWFSAQVGSDLEELSCYARWDYNSSGLNAWSAAEQSYYPYDCSTQYSGGSASVTLDDIYQDALSDEVTGFAIHSFHYDGSHGDYSRLYHFALWVR